MSSETDFLGQERLFIYLFIFLGNGLLTSGTAFFFFFTSGTALYLFIFLRDEPFYLGNGSLFIYSPQERTFYLRNVLFFTSGTAFYFFYFLFSSGMDFLPQERPFFNLKNGFLFIYFPQELTFYLRNVLFLPEEQFLFTCFPRELTFYLRNGFFTSGTDFFFFLPQELFFLFSFFFY